MEVGPVAYGLLTCSILVILGIIGSTIYGVKHTRDDDRFERHRSRMVLSSIFAIAIVLWTSIFGAILYWQEIRVIGLLHIFAYMWPLVLITIDLFFASRYERGDNGIESSRSSAIYSHASILVQASWAVATLLSIYQKSMRIKRNQSTSNMAST